MARFGIDDTKYIVNIIKAILEKEEYGQLAPLTIEGLREDLIELEKIIEKNK